MGYKVTGYEGRKLYIHPPSIEPKSRLLRVTGRVPQERWYCDILEEEGENRFKSMVEEIKQASAALRGVSTKLGILAGLCMVTMVHFLFLLCTVSHLWRTSMMSQGVERLNACDGNGGDAALG